MSEPEEGTPVQTGSATVLIPTFEDRQIIIAEGCEFHSSDLKARAERSERWASELESGPTPERYEKISDEVFEVFEKRLPKNPSRRTMRLYARKFRNLKEVTMHEDLSKALGADYIVKSDTESKYTSNPQKVNYSLSFVHTKTEFKKALETEGICIIYNGHARWGRGPCFDQYKVEYTKHGEQWEDGTNHNNGLFRMGYPFIPIGLSDLRHHHYTCRPVRAEDPRPPAAERHPYAHRALFPITLSENLRSFVAASHKSPSNRYWGLKREREFHILLQAGWTDTVNKPYDLDATDLRCKCFCHFGCSTKDHNWKIVRRPEYKGWIRPDPPIDRYAYFTTGLSYYLGENLFVKYWLLYPHQNNYKPWWESLQWAKGKANHELNAKRAGFQIY